MSESVKETPFTKTIQDYLDKMPPATEEHFYQKEFLLLSEFYDKKGLRRSDKPVIVRYGDKGIAVCKQFVDAHKTLAGAKQAMIEALRYQCALVRYERDKEFASMSPEDRAWYIRHLTRHALANSGDIFTKIFPT